MTGLITNETKPNAATRSRTKRSLTLSGFHDGVLLQAAAHTTLAWLQQPRDTGLGPHSCKLGAKCHSQFQQEPASEASPPPLSPPLISFSPFLSKITATAKKERRACSAPPPAEHSSWLATTHPWQPTPDPAHVQELRGRIGSVQGNGGAKGNASKGVPVKILRASPAEARNRVHARGLLHGPPSSYSPLQTPDLLQRHPPQLI